MDLATHCTWWQNKVAVHIAVNNTELDGLRVQHHLTCKHSGEVSYLQSMNQPGAEAEDPLVPTVLHPCYITKHCVSRNILLLCATRGEAVLGANLPLYGRVLNPSEREEGEAPSIMCHPGPRQTRITIMKHPGDWWPALCTRRDETKVACDWNRWQEAPDDVDEDECIDVWVSTTNNDENEENEEQHDTNADGSKEQEDEKEHRIRHEVKRKLYGECGESALPEKFRCIENKLEDLIIQLSTTTTN
jgi:hypothetical protein